MIMSIFFALDHFVLFVHTNAYSKLKKGEYAMGAIWDAFIIILMMGTGLFLTWKCRFIQITKFKYAIKNTIGKIFSGKAGEGEITPLQAVSTALAATVGTGNISGVIAAIALGGPGAMVWLWVSALVGMCTKYVEVLLSVKYRERNSNGEWVGGPMYYIKNGLGKNWDWLSIMFCIAGAIAAFGIGNAIQVGNICDAINAAVSQMSNDVTLDPKAISLIVGILSALFVGITIFGGIKRLGSVTEKLVPFVSIIYILSCLGVIIINIENLWDVISWIFQSAFKPEAVVGGATGITVKSCISWGIRRGVFSNEAGLGSSPIAHASTSETSPIKQGMFGIFEVFMDTVVICSLTGFAILTSGVPICYGTMEGNEVIIDAFSGIMGNRLAVIVVAGIIGFFALLTILGWGLYGCRCCEYVFGAKSVKPYQIAFVLATALSSVLDLSLIWSIADTLNGLMIVPNLIAIIALSGVAAKITKDHFKRDKLG